MWTSQNVRLKLISKKTCFKIFWTFTFRPGKAVAPKACERKSFGPILASLKCEYIFEVLNIVHIYTTYFFLDYDRFIQSSAYGRTCLSECQKSTNLDTTINYCEIVPWKMMIDNQTRTRDFNWDVCGHRQVGKASSDSSKIKDQLSLMK